MVDFDENARPEQSGWSIFRRLLREMSGHRPALILITILGALTGPLGLLNLLAFQIVAVNYLREEPLPAWADAAVPDALLGMDDRFGYLVLAGGIVLISFLLSQIVGFTYQVLSVKTRQRLVLNFRTRLFGHLERLSLAYHDEKGPSESTFRIMMDTEILPGILLDFLIPTIHASVLLVVIAAWILNLSVALALLALCVAPLQLLISWPYGKTLRHQWHGIKELDTSIMSQLQEVFSAVRVIKAFGREESETDRLLKLAEQGIERRVKVTKTQGWFGVWSNLANALGLIGFMAIGVYQVKTGAMRIEDVIVAGFLIQSLIGPMHQVIGQVVSVQPVLASAERVLGLLDTAPEVVERPDAASLERARGAIEFREATFSYEKGHPVIDRMSFVIDSGQRIGIAGHTGAGKTTLVNLLTRLYDPESGAILLDDIDLRDLKLVDLRRQFSIVLQDPVLFKKSVEDNIRYARPDATDAEVVEAARLANAHDFISAFPEGYQTIVGDRGQRVSGGERQRISLARAFLKDAPILILDEPTSSVDMRTEEAIMVALDRLMRNRTTLIIAHRPSTLASCDKVLVIEKGRVVAFAAPDSVGSLDELMLTSNRPPEQDGAENT